MFYLADKEFRRLKRRISEELPKSLNVSSDMEISLTNPSISRMDAIRQIKSEYPSFSDLSLTDIRAIGDSVNSEECMPATKKIRVDRLDKHALDLPIAKIAVPRRKSVISTWEDLVEVMPEMSEILREQRVKLEEGRIPIEFVRQTRAVSAKPAAVPVEQPVACSSPLPLENPLVSNESVDPNGGGLLAGIDDLFSSTGTKKTTNKSKSRRARYFIFSILQ